jgi:hypothetical protein
MVDVPAATPVTKPLLLFMVAMLVVPLVHVPGVGFPVSVVFEPTHTLVVPVMAGITFVIIAPETLLVVVQDEFETMQ